MPTTVHYTYLCIVGVADQLQTNYASDLRHMLKSVFDCYTSDVVARLDAAEDGNSLDAFPHRQTPTESSFGLTGRTVTSDETASVNNNHRSATSMLGTAS